VNADAVLARSLKRALKSARPTQKAGGFNSSI
jgi:hypothetical protein